MQLSLGRVVGHVTFNKHEVACFGRLQLKVLKVLSIGGHVAVELGGVFRLVDNLKTHVLLQVLVGSTADADADQSIFFSDLEFVLSK